MKIVRLVYYDLEVEVFARGRSLVKRTSTECGVCRCERGTSTMRRPGPGPTRAVEP